MAKTPWFQVTRLPRKVPIFLVPQRLGSFQRIFCWAFKDSGCVELTLRDLPESLSRIEILNPEVCSKMGNSKSKWMVFWDHSEARNEGKMLLFGEGDAADAAQPGWILCWCNAKGRT